MFCFNCGKQLPDEARFCAYCGTSLAQLKDSFNKSQNDAVNNEISCCAEVKASEPVPQKVVEKNTKPETPEEKFLWAQKLELGTDGVECNPREAFNVYVEAAKGGCKEAQFRLGCAYENGELGLKVNEEKACDWYEQAANNGYVEAMFILAEAYEYGSLDLDEDEDEAFDWYLEAAENGHVKSQFIVAEAYELENLGVDEDLEEARDWYLKAAENGHTEAMYKVADIFYWLSRDIADAAEEDDDEDFEVSEGEEQCLAVAKYWYTKAAENGHAQAKRMLKQYFSK